MSIVIIGIPLDFNSSHLRGPAEAPGLIETALNNDSANMWTEDLIDLTSTTGWQMLPAMILDDEASAFNTIETEVEAQLAQGNRVISLGGDHSITYPIMRAYARTFEQLNILHFDAHPDLYDELLGNRHSHACPFARIMEEKLVTRLVQVGIRTMTGHQHAQVERFGVEVIQMKNISAASNLTFNGPVYISFDMDCLDPAYAPGVSHQEPGGMSTRDVLSIIQKLRGQIVGADIVEYNPRRDINGVTAMVAAKLLKEILSRMLK